MIRLALSIAVLPLSSRCVDWRRSFRVGCMRVVLVWWCGCYRACTGASFAVAAAAAAAADECRGDPERGESKEGAEDEGG